MKLKSLADAQLRFMFWNSKNEKNAKRPMSLYAHGPFVCASFGMIFF